MNCFLGICDGSGLIEVKDEFEQCQCKPIENAIRIYQRSNAPGDNMIFTEDLEENPIVQNEKKQEKPMKELIHSLLENGMIEKLIQENWFLYLVGMVGRGKTQMATSLILEAGYWRNYRSVFIDERSLEHIVFNTDKKNKLLDEVGQAQILVIDDIGVTGKSSHNPNMVQSVVNLLDYIIRNHKGLIIFTSNVKSENLDKSYSVANAQQLVSVINKARKKTYIFAKENIRETVKPAEIDSFF